MSEFDHSAHVLLKRTLKECARAKRWFPSQPATLQAELALVGAARMQKLNREFRKKDSATDILSFPSPKPLRRLGHLGELVICTPVLKRQAREQGHPAETERAVLIVHGVLHLLGLDHETGPAAHRLQARWEARILKAIRVRAQAGLMARLPQAHASGIRRPL